MSYAILALFLGEQFSGKEHRKNRKKGRSHYEKIISVLAAAGVIAALSIPAFLPLRDVPPAMRRPSWKPLSPLLAKVSIPTLPPQTKPLDNKDSEHRGVTLVEDGGEYVAELGEKLEHNPIRQRTPFSNSPILPESPRGRPDGRDGPPTARSMAFRPPFSRLRQNAAEENSEKEDSGDCVLGPDDQRTSAGNKIPPTSFSAFRCGYKNDWPALRKADCKTAVLYPYFKSFGLSDFYIRIFFNAKCLFRFFC